MVSSDTVSVDLGEKDIADLQVAGNRILAEDYLAGRRRISIDSIQRGVSWSLKMRIYPSVNLFGSLKTMWTGLLRRHSDGRRSITARPFD